MKKISLVLTLLISVFLINIHVFAEISVGGATEEQSTFSKYKSEFNNPKQQTINDSGFAVVNGHSVCSGSSCTVSYSSYNGSTSSDFRDALKSNVVCSNGEKYITYQESETSGGAGWKTDNSAQYTGEAYWTESYYVTCTTSGSGSSTVALKFTLDDSSSSSSSSSNNYGTSSTVNQEQTGVESYFIVLALVALVSYVLMLCVKKFNLFKSI